MSVQYRYIEIQEAPQSVVWVGFSEAAMRARDWDDLRDILLSISSEKMQKIGFSWQEVRENIVLHVLQKDMAQPFPKPLGILEEVVQRLLDEHGAKRALQIFLDMQELEQELHQRRVAYFQERRKCLGIFQRCKRRFLGELDASSDEQVSVQRAYEAYTMLLQEYRNIKEVRDYRRT